MCQWRASGQSAFSGPKSLGRRRKRARSTGGGQSGLPGRAGRKYQSARRARWMRSATRCRPSSGIVRGSPAAGGVTCYPNTQGGDRGPATPCAPTHHPGHGRAGGRPAAHDQPGQRRAGPEGDHVRHARRGGLREAHGRDQPAHVPARGRRAMTDLARMRELAGSTCIVGVDESDELGTLPHKSQLSLHVEAVHNAVRDAGLKVSDVDGVFTAGQHSPATIAEALGVTPRYVDGTTVGGCSFIIMVGHAMVALHHGLCDVAVISHGESGRSGVGVTPRRDTALPGQFETPYGFGGAPTMFGLITTRHMHEHGTRLEQWAQVAVSTRKWVALNPKAKNREPITVQDVLDSRPVVWPFNVLNICLVTDAGGAVVMTRADRARDCAKKPVYVRGAGEG